MDTKITPKITYDKVTKRRKVVKSHTHVYYELYYLISGETAYFVGDEVYHLAPNDFIIVPKGIIHSTDSQNCLHNERLLVTFDDDIFDERTIGYLHTLCRQRIIHIKQGQIPAFEQLLHRMQKEDLSSTLGILYILELIVLLSIHQKSADEKLNKSDTLTDDIVKYIRKNYEQEITLKSLAQRFGMSESSLSRKFKDETGIGLWEFITQVRIFNAENILKTQNISITKVAELCGFSDSNYFATVFKKIKGITPLKYRKSHLS